MKKGEFTHTVWEGEELVSFNATKEVKKHGNSAYIILPKEMIGKKVKITYEK